MQSPLRHRCHTTLPHPNPTGATQSLCLDAVKLPGASTLGLDPCSAGITPDLNSGEKGRRLNFSSPVHFQPFLTPATLPQGRSTSILGIQEPETFSINRAASSAPLPPQVLDAGRPAQQLRPPQALGEPHNNPPFLLC